MNVLNDVDRQKLIPFYIDTDYHIPDLNSSLKIGKLNQTVDDWLSEHAATHAVFITAFNPNSKAISQPFNQKSNIELAKHFDTNTYLIGSGIPRSNDWIPEESFLVIDLPIERTFELMRQFDQLAVVWHQLGQASRLLWRDGSYGI